MTKKININKLDKMTESLLKRINGYTVDMSKLTDDQEFKRIVLELMEQDLDTIMELLGRCVIAAGIAENPLDNILLPKDKDNT